MLSWFANNLGTIAVALVVVAVVAGVLFSLGRGKKQGKSPCGGNCGCCGGCSASENH